MTPWERDYHHARILAGALRCVVDGRAYLLGPADREALYGAEEAAREARAEAAREGLYTADEALGVLIDRGLWTADLHERLERLEKDIDDLKVTLYEKRDNEQAADAIRGALATSRGERDRLESLRHALDHVTVEGAAGSARARHLAGACLRRPGGRPYWEDPEAGWSRPDRVLDAVMAHAAAARLDEAGIREVAREEPFRSSWGAAKSSGAGLLGKAAADLSDEQRALLLWAAAYDAIRDHPETPGEDALRDDDCLDGWMIVQRRRRDSERARRGADSLVRPGMEHADEIFKVVGSKAEARKVHDYNDDFGKLKIRQRMSHLRARGVAHEAEMPGRLLNG